MMKILGIGLIVFVLFAVQQWCYRSMWNRNLRVSLVFGRKTMFEGEEGELLEVIENRKRMPLPMLKVKFQTHRNLEFADDNSSKTTDQYYRNDVFRVGGGEKITRTLTFKGGKRGYYKINGLDLVAADLLMSAEMVESREVDQHVYVYPRPFQGREFCRALQQINGEMLTRSHLLEDPFEYRGIREYQPYDDMRSVNWKATARTGELKVNQKNYTALKSVRIFFNTEDSGILKKQDSVETALQVTAGLAEHFLKQGVRTACYGNGRDIVNGDAVRIGPSAGSGQMECILKALARVDTDVPAADFCEQFGKMLLSGEKGAMTFFVSPNAYEDFTRLLSEYAKQDQDFIWFCPAPAHREPEAPPALRSNVRMIIHR